METKIYTYRGHRIVKSFGKYRITTMAWGDQPGEVHSFSALKRAQAFVDRMIEERAS